MIVLYDEMKHTGGEGGGGWGWIYRNFNIQCPTNTTNVTQN